MSLDGSIMTKNLMLVQFPDLEYIAFWFIAAYLHHILLIVEILYLYPHVKYFMAGKFSVNNDVYLHTDIWYTSFHFYLLMKFLNSIISNFWKL